MVWPEKFWKVGYYYEMENEVLELKPHGKALAATLEQMLREEILPPVVERRDWDEPSV